MKSTECMAAFETPQLHHDGLLCGLFFWILEAVREVSVFGNSTPLGQDKVTQFFH
jgi:hypothetical protein